MKPNDELTEKEAFNLGSSVAVKKVLAEVENESKNRTEKGFNETNFTIGVLNSFLIVYVFGAFPQHFWLLYLIEASILIPMKYFQLKNSQPLDASLYIIDYCWAMNYIGVFTLLILAFTNEFFHKELFIASIGIACGPLLGAAGALPFVALVFHDVGVMCDVFIHIYPPMLLYTLYWKADEILKSWPGIFVALNYEVDFFPTEETRQSSLFGWFGGGTVFGNTIILYFCWLVPYVYWIIKFGMDLPNSGYDTVFHSNMRKGLCEAIGTIFWKRPVEESKRHVAANDFETKDLFVYLTGHVIGVTLSLLLLAYPCYKSEFLHGFLLVVLSIVVVWRGAMRYHYYGTMLYVKVIRRLAAEQAILEESANENSPLLK